jgi:predicted small lipoprotein YifL
MTARSLLVVLLLSAGFLAGCGKTGLLEQPAPLFGADAKAHYEAQKKADADAKARAAAAKKADSTAPIVDDPDGRPMTNGTMPQVPGAPSNPFASGPQGALPSPGTSPNP